MRPLIKQKMIIRHDAHHMLSEKELPCLLRILPVVKKSAKRCPKLKTCTRNLKQSHAELTGILESSYRMWRIFPVLTFSSIDSCGTKRSHVVSLCDLLSLSLSLPEVVQVQVVQLSHPSRAEAKFRSLFQPRHVSELLLFYLQAVWCQSRIQEVKCA